jgi:hypothetical protein
VVDVEAAEGLRRAGLVRGAVPGAARRVADADGLRGSGPPIDQPISAPVRNKNDLLQKVLLWSHNNNFWMA